VSPAQGAHSRRCSKRDRNARNPAANYLEGVSDQALIAMQQQAAMFNEQLVVSVLAYRRELAAARAMIAERDRELAQLRSAQASSSQRRISFSPMATVYKNQCCVRT
jgi:hypothetical protein